MNRKVFSLSPLLLVLACSISQHHAKEPGFTVERDRVTLHRSTPLSFETAEARPGASLPRPPVTGRITTVEALTSPSFAPLEGRVVEARVHLGDRVRKGQKLVLVRTAELSTLTRERQSAELTVASKSDQVARLKALVEVRAGSMNDLILAQHEADEAKVSLAAAKARLSSLQIARADETSYWVLATRDGTVVELNAATGLEVGPSRGVPIVMVADLAEVLAVADVPQRVAADLSAGMSATIHTSRTEPHEARVETVADVVDPERQTVPVRVRADNRLHTLRPNAYVELSFPRANVEHSLLLPAACVVRDGAQSVVFVEDQRGSFVRREVKVGQEGRDQVEVLSGLKSGERVVSTGALLLLNALDSRAES
jgi:cobalt-zinc-cadmium efflux system membrane fusion protein